MLLDSKKNLDPALHKSLKDYVYDVVGYAMDVCRQLPCGLPEYIYQEAFAKVLTKHNINPHKEYQYHPTFDGEPLQAYLKMDFMVERERGNIIIEAKAIEKLSNRERSQTLRLYGRHRLPYWHIGQFRYIPKAHDREILFR